MVAISLLHGILCCVVIYWCGRCLAMGRGAMVAVATLTFVVLDSVGLCIAPYVPLGSVLLYLPPGAFPDRFTDTDVYFRNVASHWVFFAIAGVGLILGKGIKTKGALREPGFNLRTKLLLAILLLFSISGYYRYFFNGPGLALLKSTQLTFDSTQEAIAARSEVEQQVETGQGAYSASLASKIALPLAAAVLMHGGLRVSLLCWTVCGLFSLAYAYQTRQKAPVLEILLLYGLLLVPVVQRFYGRRKQSRPHFKYLFLGGALTALILFAGGTLFYSINSGLTYQEAIVSVLGRAFLLPPAVEHIYFQAFPETFPFRGFLRSFVIALAPEAGTGDVGIYDIARQMTGDTFSANASFIAVAWSGYGFAGVFAASVALVGALALVDRLLARAPERSYVLGLLVGFPLAIPLVSGCLMDFIGWGGVVFPAALAMAFSELPRSIRRTPAKAKCSTKIASGNALAYQRRPDCQDTIKL